ncbi:MAG: hypothetical protein EP348_03535 [Alphaproteobacteria bacterium]|nr:MAG: hypothetical protein EP348_03535 [Alphaproteobacteria bacterium]
MTHASLKIDTAASLAGEALSSISRASSTDATIVPWTGSVHRDRNGISFQEKVSDGVARAHLLRSLACHQAAATLKNGFLRLFKKFA